MPRRFKPPWTAERIPGGYVVKDATGQSLAYAMPARRRQQADTATVLTMDEARRGRQQHRQAADAAETQMSGGRPPSAGNSLLAAL